MSGGENPNTRPAAVLTGTYSETAMTKCRRFLSKLENFRGAINGTEELLITPQDAIASVQVIDAAYKSLNQNLWQPIVEKTMSKKRLIWQEFMKRQ